MSLSAQQAVKNSAPPSAQQVIKNFAPSWFAAVMGTGVLALGAGFLGHQFAPLAVAAGVLHWFNVALFLLLLLPWTLRWFQARPQAAGSLVHPVVGNFVATVAIALLVLALQFLQLAHAPEIALPLWWLGAVLAFGFSFLILFKQFTGEQVMLDHVTPGMFVPPVGLVVIPVAGAPLALAAGGAAQGWMLLVCFIGLGSGAFAVASFKLSGLVPLPGMFAVGIVAFGLLALFWGVTLARSVLGALDGSLFQPH